MSIDFLTVPDFKAVYMYVLLLAPRRWAARCTPELPYGEIAEGDFPAGASPVGLWEILYLFF